MNVNGSLTADQFLRFLSVEAPAGHYFVAQPPPGIIMTAAIDWRVIIPDTEAAQTLATALWSGYEELVKPQVRAAGDDSAGMFVQIKNLSGDCDQFMVGRDIQQRDGFLSRVKETVAVLSSRDAESVNLELQKTSSSDYWVKLS